MANEPDSGSTPVKPAMKKLMYKSPLSGIRSAPYKPPVDKSGFNPIGVSSPKLANNAEGDRFALVVDGPQQGRPSPRSANLENERTPNHGVDSKPSPTGDNSVIHPSLGGRGGHWRGPQGNDMSPETRRGGRPRGFNSSPASEGAVQWYYSPAQNVNDGSNNSFGSNSFRHINFRNNGSFGSNPHSPNSPRGQFNSSDRSRNSPRNNRRGGGHRGGNHGHGSNGDISMFYSSMMNVDPWSTLMREKMSASSFQSKTVDRGSGSIINVNLSSDSEMDEGMVSQDNDIPVGEESA